VSISSTEISPAIARVSNSIVVSAQSQAVGAEVPQELNAIEATITALNIFVIFFIILIQL
jgi:hypothetical protein